MRPIKAGLDYFSHDVNMGSDQRVEYLEAEHGIVGYAVYVKLLERIYNTGYYTKFTERDIILMARRTGIKEEELSNIVNTCIRERLFSKELFDKYSILTSRGIQKRYIKACERRKVVEIVEEFNLQEKLPEYAVSVKIESCSDFVEEKDIKPNAPKKVPKNENKPKEVPQYDPEVYVLFDLFKSTLANGQEVYLPKKEIDKNQWLDTFDKLKRIDGYDWWKIADIVYYTRGSGRKDDFWVDKFFTPLKLRTKNKENMKFIDYFWGKYQDKLEEPEGSALEYIEGLIYAS